MAPFSPPSDLVIRPARPDDAPRLGALWARAFPGERTAEERTRTLLEGADPWGGLDTCRVGEIDGRTAGAYRAYALKAHLFGRPVPTLGLGAVAVSPEFRRRGVGGALCRDALRLGRERGDLLSILYPFRVDFYHRLGWALVGEVHRYRFAPEELPLFPGRERVRILEGEARRASVPPLYRRLLPHRHGPLDRPDRAWKALDDSTRLVVGVRRDGGETGPGSERLTGAAVFRSRPDRGGRGAALVLEELHVEDAGSYRAILGWLSAQRDQWRRLTWDALPGERFHEVLAHPRIPATPPRRSLWFESATLLRGPMARILAVDGLAERLGVRNGIRVEVADAEIPEQTGVWEADGNGGLRRTSGEVGAGALPIPLLSSLVLRGGLPGFGTAPEDFRPAMGLSDFHLLDSF